MNGYILDRRRNSKELHKITIYRLGGLVSVDPSRRIGAKKAKLRYELDNNFAGLPSHDFCRTSDASRPAWIKDRAWSLIAIVDETHVEISDR